MDPDVVLLNNTAFLLIVLGLPLYYAVRYGRIARTVFLSWVILVSWFVLQAFVLGPLVYSYDRTLAEFFSDGPSVIAALVGGPIWGVFVSAFAQLVRYLLARFAPFIFRRVCRPAS